MLKKSIVVGMALMLAGAASAGAAGTEHKSKEKSGKAAGKEVSIHDLNRNPKAFLNKKVTTSGEFNQSLAAGIFVLDGPGVLNDQIVVVTKQAMKGKAGEQAGMADFSKDEPLEVSGKLQRMSVVEIERGYNVDLDPTVEMEFEGTVPVIVADSKDIARMDTAGETGEMSGEMGGEASAESSAQ